VAQLFWVLIASSRLIHYAKAGFGIGVTIAGMKKSLLSALSRDAPVEADSRMKRVGMRYGRRVSSRRTSQSEWVKRKAATRHAS